MTNGAISTGLVP